MNTRVLRTTLIILLVIAIGIALFQRGVFDRFVLERVLLSKDFDAHAIKKVRLLAQNSNEWKNRWLGIDVLQYPGDMVTYQNIISEVQPDLIIETGTHSGGLSLYLSMLLEFTRPEANIITVDIDDKRWQETVRSVRTPALETLMKRIEFIKGSSTDARVLKRISQRVFAGARVMVLLDSLHTREHVLRELNSYTPFVSKESYLIVNDTHIDHTNVVDYGPGPLSAIQEFLRTNRSFVIDRSRDRFLIACTRSGYLKRVR